MEVVPVNNAAGNNNDRELHYILQRLEHGLVNQ